MNIKEGQIVKVTEVKSDYYEIQNTKGQIFVIIGLLKVTNRVKLMNQNSKFPLIIDLDLLIFGSCRLKPELRNGLMELYKSSKKCEKLEEEIQRLNSELQMQRRGMWETQNGMVEEFSTISSDTISNITNSETFFTETSDMTIKFGIGFGVELDKWVNPDDYSYLYREYDSSIGIHYEDKEGMKKDYLNIKPYENIVNKLKEETKAVKGVKFTGISDNISIGDKDTLHASKIFAFECNKDVLISDLKPLFSKIDNHIKKIESNFQDKY